MNKEMTFRAIEGSELYESQEEVVNSVPNFRIETAPGARVVIYLTSVPGRPKVRVFSGYADQQGNFEKDIHCDVFPKYFKVSVKGPVKAAWISTN